VDFDRISKKLQDGAYKTLESAIEDIE